MIRKTCDKCGEELKLKNRTMCNKCENDVVRGIITGDLYLIIKCPVCKKRNFYQKKSAKVCKQCGMRLERI